MATRRYPIMIRYYKRGNASARIKITSRRTIPNELLAEIRRIITRNYRYLQRITPKKRGRLRRSLRRRGSVAGSDGLRLVFQIFYSKYVERGTRYIRPRRFLRKTLSRLADELEDTGQISVTRVNF